MKKILITGCGGMLGEAVYSEFNKDYIVYATDKDVNEKWITYLDVREFETVEKTIKKLKPDYIFHLAALTDLEFCERFKEDTYKTNAMATENIARICEENKIIMIYISTAGIFSGKDYYNDYDIPRPINTYGLSKYAGEIAVKKLKKYFVFRPGWMMGGFKKDKKFVGKIIKQIRSGKKTINALTDIYGTPTYTYDFAKNIKLIIESNDYGVYNLVCSGECSRYDVAKEILQHFKGIKLNKVKGNYFKKEYFAKRPKSERLIPLKLKIKNKYTMRDWKTCLHQYLNTIVRWN